jgi:hypothetical protein
MLPGRCGLIAEMLDGVRAKKVRLYRILFESRARLTLGVQSIGDERFIDCFL